MEQQEEKPAKVSGTEHLLEAIREVAASVGADAAEAHVSVGLAPASATIPDLPPWELRSVTVVFPGPSSEP